MPRAPARRATSATVAPASASARLVAAPMPLDAPVTSAVVRSIRIARHCRVRRRDLPPTRRIEYAGIGRYRPFVETDAEETAAILETNLHAALSFTRALLPGMLARRRGHVVNVA